MGPTPRATMIVIRMSADKETLPKETKPDMFTDIGPHDVVSGRGLTVARFSGNKRFRSIVLANLDKYFATRSRVLKEQIARDVIQQVTERGGRFLTRLAPLEKKQWNIPSNVDAWKECDRSLIMEKVKQAFRDCPNPRPARETSPMGPPRDVLTRLGQLLPPALPTASPSLSSSALAQIILQQQQQQALSQATTSILGPPPQMTAANLAAAALALQQASQRANRASQLSTLLALLQQPQPLTVAAAPPPISSLANNSDLLLGGLDRQTQHLLAALSPGSTAGLDLLQAASTQQLQAIQPITDSDAGSSTNNSSATLAWKPPDCGGKSEKDDNKDSR